MPPWSASTRSECQTFTKASMILKRLIINTMWRQMAQPRSKTKTVGAERKSRRLQVPPAWQNWKVPLIRIWTASKLMEKMKHQGRRWQPVAHLRWPHWSFWIQRIFQIVTYWITHLCKAKAPMIMVWEIQKRSRSIPKKSRYQTRCRFNQMMARSSLKMSKTIVKEIQKSQKKLVWVNQSPWPQISTALIQINKMRKTMQPMKMSSNSLLTTCPPSTQSAETTSKISTKPQSRAKLDQATIKRR